MAKVALRFKHTHELFSRSACPLELVATRTTSHSHSNSGYTHGIVHPTHPHPHHFYSSVSIRTVSSQHPFFLRLLPLALSGFTRVVRQPTWSRPLMYKAVVLISMIEVDQPYFYARPCHESG